MAIKSRILEFLPEPLLKELKKICDDRTIADNNSKVDMMVAALDKYDVPYNELGPGTNRFAILIDGYVFKIAMDRLGIKDNIMEFSLAQELQPFVVKVYECNDLIIVAEYVTVISKEEFIDKTPEIRRILSMIADRYLMGDVGTVPKNFMNWGYRDDGELVILDFAYIYRIEGSEMVCEGIDKAGNVCKAYLDYDENFYNLVCPQCGKKYRFTDIRAKIDPDYEEKEVRITKQLAYRVSEPLTKSLNVNKKISSVQYNNQPCDDQNHNKGEYETMYDYEEKNTKPEINVEDEYEKALAELMSGPISSSNDDPCESQIIVKDVANKNDMMYSSESCEYVPAEEVQSDEDENTTEELTNETLSEVIDEINEVDEDIPDAVPESEEDHGTSEAIDTEVNVDNYPSDTTEPESCDYVPAEEVQSDEDEDEEVPSNVSDLQITIESESPVTANVVYSTEAPTSFIKVIQPDSNECSDIDDMRHSLTEGLTESDDSDDDENYDDDFDTIYDYGVKQNQDLKFSKKSNKFEQ